MAITTTGSSQLGALLESNGPSTPRPNSSATAKSVQFKEVMVETLPAAAPRPGPAPVDAALAALPSHVSPFVPPPDPELASGSDLVPISGAAERPAGMVEQPTTPELGQRSEAAVRAALDAAGIDHSGLTFDYWEAWQWFPGGSYMYHGLNVSTGDGRTFTFGADLSERYPQITAQNIQEYLTAQDV
jgi:hypothetical protein